MTTKKGKAAVRVIALAVCAVMLIAFGTGCTTDALARAEEAYQAALKAEQAANNANQAANNAQTSADNALDKAEGAGSVAGSKLTEQEVIAAITNALSSYVKKDYVDKAVADALETYAKTASVEEMLAAYVKNEDVEAKIAAAIEKIGVTEGAATKAELEAAIATIVKEETIKSWIEGGNADVVKKIEEELKKYQTVEASAAAVKTLTDTVAKLQKDLTAAITKAVEDLTAADAALTKKLTDEIARLDGVDAATKVDLVKVIKDCATNTEGLAAALERIKALESGLTPEQYNELKALAEDFDELTKELGDFKTVATASLEALRKADEDMKAEIEELTKLYTALAKDITDAKKLIGDLEIAYRNADKEIIDRIDAIDEKLEKIGTSEDLEALKAQLDTVVKTDIPALKALIGRVEALENLSSSYIAIEDYNKVTNGDPENDVAGVIDIFAKFELEYKDDYEHFVTNQEIYAAGTDKEAKTIYYKAVAKVLRSLTLADVEAAEEWYLAEYAKLEKATLANVFYDRIVALQNKLEANGFILSTEFDEEKGEYVENELTASVRNLYMGMYDYVNVAHIFSNYETKDGKTVELFDVDDSDDFLSAAEMLDIYSELAHLRIDVDDINSRIEALVVCADEDCGCKAPWEHEYVKYAEVMQLKSELASINSEIDDKKSIYSDVLAMFDGKNQQNLSNFLVGEENFEAIEAYIESVEDILKELYDNIAALNDKYDGYISHVDDADYIADLEKAVNDFAEADEKYEFLTSGYIPAEMSDIEAKLDELESLNDYAQAVLDVVKVYNENVLGDLQALAALKGAYKYGDPKFGVAEDTFGNWGLYVDQKDEIPGSNVDAHIAEIVDDALAADLTVIKNRQELLSIAAEAADAINNGGVYAAPYGTLIEEYTDVLLNDVYYLREDGNYLLISDNTAIEFMLELGYEIHGEYWFGHPVQGILGFYDGDVDSGYELKAFGNIVPAIDNLRDLENTVKVWKETFFIDEINEDLVEEELLENALAEAKKIVDAIVEDELVATMRAALADYNKYKALDEENGELKLYAAIAASKANAALKAWFEEYSEYEIENAASYLDNVIEFKDAELQTMVYAVNVAFANNDYRDLESDANSEFVAAGLDEFETPENIDVYSAEVKAAWKAATEWVEKYLADGEFENVTDSERFLTKEIYDEIVEAYGAYKAAVAAEIAKFNAIRAELAPYYEYNLYDIAIESANFDEIKAKIEEYAGENGENLVGIDSEVLTAYETLVAYEEDVLKHFDDVTDSAVAAFGTLTDLATITPATVNSNVDLLTARMFYEEWLDTYVGENTLADVEYTIEILNDAYEYGVALAELEADFAIAVEAANKAGLENFVNASPVLAGTITSDSKAAVEAARAAFNAWANNAEYGPVDTNAWYKGCDPLIKAYYTRLLAAETALGSIEDARDALYNKIVEIDNMTTPKDLINAGNYNAATCPAKDYTDAVAELRTLAAEYLALVPSAGDENGNLIADYAGNYPLGEEKVNAYNKACAYADSVELIKAVYTAQFANQSAFAAGVIAGTHANAVAFDTANHAKADELLAAIYAAAETGEVYVVDDEATEAVETVETEFAAVLEDYKLATPGEPTDADRGYIDTNWDI